MSAFSTVGDVFADPAFSALVTRSCVALVPWKSLTANALGFSSCPYKWRVDSHGCYKFNNADLALGPRDTTAHFPIFLHLRTTNFPAPDRITRSEQAQQRRVGTESYQA